MGSLKDQMIPEDDWNHLRLTQAEYNYLKNMNTFVEQQQQYLQGMLVGFMKIIAIQNGYSPTDVLDFDVDLDHNDLQLKVRRTE